MRLLVFGATGSVGREVVPRAREEGYDVTVFVRNAARVRVAAERVEVGDVLDPDAVHRVVKGHDAVICCLGAGAKGRVRGEGTRNIVRAMERAGVRRLVCQSTLGAGESRGNLNFFWKHVMFGALLRAAYRDHEVQESAVRASAVEWTLVRPAAFTDGPRTGRYRHGFAPDDRTTTLKISRADVADFLVRQLTDGAYLRRAPGLSY